MLRLPKSTTVKSYPDADFARLDALPQFPGIACLEVQVQVTQQQGFGRFNLVTRWKRAYRQNKANQVWYLLTNLDCLETALESYAKRFSIEESFLDLKSNGFNLEASKLRDKFALSQLCGVLALTMLFLVLQGVQVVASGKRRQVDAHWNRGMSYLKLGWNWIRLAITHQWKIDT